MRMKPLQLAGGRLSGFHHRCLDQDQRHRMAGERECGRDIGPLLDEDPREGALDRMDEVLRDGSRCRENEDDRFGGPDFSDPSFGFGQAVSSGSGSAN